MREDRHDDLVSTTAIVAGSVAGVAVTLMSLLLSGEESAPPPPAEATLAEPCPELVQPATSGPVVPGEARARVELAGDPLRAEGCARPTP